MVDVKTEVLTVKTPPIIAQTFVMKWEKDLGTSVTKTWDQEIAGFSAERS